MESPIEDEGRTPADHADCRRSLGPFIEWPFLMSRRKILAVKRHSKKEPIVALFIQ